MFFEIINRFLKHQIKHENIILGIFFVRLFVALLIFFFPPISIILLSIFLDTIDGVFLKNFLNVSNHFYQYYDKVADYFYYIILLLSLMDRGLIVFPLLLALFIYRTIGEFIFFITDREELFVFFPNFFEVFAILFLITSSVDNLYYQRLWLIPVSFFIITAKIYHEIFIHKQKKSFLKITMRAFKIKSIGSLNLNFNE